MQKNKINTFLFDFDGTLVDSMPTYASSMIRILDENDVNYPNDIIKIITPLGLIGAADYFVSLGINLSKNEIIEKMKFYMLNEYLYNIPAKNNVLLVLRKLKECGACLNVLTASPHVTLDPCLKRLGLFDLFANVWSCDDFNTTKADPNIYKMAADNIGVDINHIIFLDDNINAVKTAKTAGMKVCGVFDESSEEFTEEIKFATDFYINDFSELLKIAECRNGQYFKNN